MGTITEQLAAAVLEGDDEVAASHDLRKRREVLPAVRRHDRGRHAKLLPDASDALVDAGASLVQIYTGLVYRGPFFVRDLNRGLLTLLAT